MHYKYCKCKRRPDKGLQLRQGGKVSLITVKKAMDIVWAKVEELHQPARLEAMCGRVIKKTVADVGGKFKDLEALPLPEVVIDIIAFGEYDLEPDGNYADDETFSRWAKNVVSMLWSHLGYTIIRRREHPFLRF